MNINPRKEAKSHTKNNGHFATKADLKDTEHHLNIEILATKHDLKDAKNELKGDIARLESSTKTDITRLESRIGNVETNIKWLIAISLANFSILLSGVIGIITMLFSK